MFRARGYIGRFLIHPKDIILESFSIFCENQEDDKEHISSRLSPIFYQNLNCVPPQLNKPPKPER